MLGKKSFGVLILFSAIGLSSVSASAFNCPENFFNGQTPAITKASLLQRSAELCFDEFAVLHSGLTRTPLWSAEHLTRQRIVDAKMLTRTDEFHPESRLPASDRAELPDYVRSGYDRGHMSPLADMSTSQAQDQSFSMANMVPQLPALNRNLWSHIESSVRALTNTYDDVYVVTGPAFASAQLQRLNGRVFVPTQTFKAVYVPSINQAGVYWADNSGSGNTFDVISLDDLKAFTDIDPFPGLDPSVKATATNLPKPRAFADREMAGEEPSQKSNPTYTGSIAKPSERSSTSTWWSIGKAVIKMMN